MVLPDTCVFKNRAQVNSRIHKTPKQDFMKQGEVLAGHASVMGSESHHVGVSSRGRHPRDDVFPHVSLCRFPTDFEFAGGGIIDLQVSHRASWL